MSNEPVVHEGHARLTTGRSLGQTVAALAGMFALAAGFLILIGDAEPIVGVVAGTGGWALMSLVIWMYLRRRVRITASTVEIRGALWTRRLPLAQIDRAVYLASTQIPGVSGYIGLLDARGRRLWGSNTAPWPQETIRALLVALPKTERELHPITPTTARERWPGLLPFTYGRPMLGMALGGLSVLLAVGLVVLIVVLVSE